MKIEKKVEGKIRVIILMLVMMMGCNSGGVGESKESVENQFLQSLVNVSNEFLNVFTSFGDMVGSVLGLNLESKKSDVGKYFKTVQGSVASAFAFFSAFISATILLSPLLIPSTESAVNKLVSETLNKIIAGEKEASEAIGTDNDPIANIGVQGSAGAAVQDNSVKSLIEGLDKIVGVVLKDKGNPTAGNDKKAEDNTTARSNNGDDAGKLFAGDNAGANANANKAAADAAKAVGAVIGADILKAIVKGDSGKAVLLAKNTANNNAVADAANATDAAVAGAVALRAMAKGGKFANGSDTDIATSVKAAAVSAVTKVLDTLTIAIRKTIDAGLKEVKGTMKINVNEPAVITESKN
ncbi:Variable outer membrane protein (plasmid) [Borrelia crocidurae DOU]|uniref:Variable large protein n=1 Tax=Borrelia crocidurae DOU TaxID=1293575 RepID=W5SKN0_9SPIR|nr:variable large family protein [Borrelia crocidurae]AHH07719.1 Variable outer membrane protein [Borrelia crocidurae DOU]